MCYPDFAQGDEGVPLNSSVANGRVGSQVKGFNSYMYMRSGLINPNKLDESI